MQCVPENLQDNLPLLKALMAYVALGGFLEADPDMKPLQKVWRLLQLQIQMPLVQRGSHCKEIWC